MGLALFSCNKTRLVDNTYITEFGKEVSINKEELTKVSDEDKKDILASMNIESEENAIYKDAYNQMLNNSESLVLKSELVDFENRMKQNYSYQCLIIDMKTKNMRLYVYQYTKINSKVESSLEMDIRAIYYHDEDKNGYNIYTSIDTNNYLTLNSIKSPLSTPVIGQLYHLSGKMNIKTDIKIEGETPYEYDSDKIIAHIFSLSNVTYKANKKESSIFTNGDRSKIYVEFEDGAYLYENNLLSYTTSENYLGKTSTKYEYLEEPKVDTSINEEAYTNESKSFFTNLVQFNGSEWRPNLTYEELDKYFEITIE